MCRWHHLEARDVWRSTGHVFLGVCLHGIHVRLCKQALPTTRNVRGRTSPRIPGMISLRGGLRRARVRVLVQGSGRLGKGGRTRTRIFHKPRASKKAQGKFLSDNQSVKINFGSLLYLLLDCCVVVHEVHRYSHQYHLTYMV